MFAGPANKLLEQIAPNVVLVDARDPACCGLDELRAKPDFVLALNTVRTPQQLTDYVTMRLGTGKGSTVQLDDPAVLGQAAVHAEMANREDGCCCTAPVWVVNPTHFMFVKSDREGMTVSFSRLFPWESLVRRYGLARPYYCNFASKQLKNWVAILNPSVSESCCRGRTRGPSWYTTFKAPTTTRGVACGRLLPYRGCISRLALVWEPLVVCTPPWGIRSVQSSPQGTLLSS